MEDIAIILFVNKEPFDRLQATIRVLIRNEVFDAHILCLRSVLAMFR